MELFIFSCEVTKNPVHNNMNETFFSVKKIKIRIETMHVSRITYFVALAGKRIDFTKSISCLRSSSV